MTYNNEYGNMSAQRQAQKAFRSTETKLALNQYQQDQEAFHANRNRLKAERLARAKTAETK